MGIIRAQPFQSSSVDSVGAATMASNSDDLDCGLTCNGYNLCRHLQRFAKPKVFVTVFSFFALTHGVVEGYFAIHYFTNSAKMSVTFVEWMFVVSDILQALVILPLVFVGGRRSRPVWLAAIGAFLSISCGLFAVLLLSEHTSEEVKTVYSELQDPTLCILWSNKIISNYVNWYWLTLIFMYFVHVGIGLVWIGIMSLGLTFLDDNTDMKTSPAVIGVVLAVKQLGPRIGNMMAWLCTSTTITGILWIVLGFNMLLVSIMLGLFPRRLLDSDGGNVSPSATSYYTKNKGYFSSIWRIISNKIILLITFALIFLMTAMQNFLSLQSQYEESVYYATRVNGYDDPWTSRTIIGYVGPVLVGLSFLFTGLFIHRVKPSAIRIALWNVIATCFVAIVLFSYIFITCSDTKLHSESNNKLDLVELCNKDCQCSDNMPFTPVCAEKGMSVYYSPCHAGCTSVTYSGNSRVYRNCTCVPTESVTSGICHYGACTIYWILFQMGIVLCCILLATIIIGNLVICFRSVLINDKPIMIGFQTMLVTLIAHVPGRFLYKFIGNLSCIVLGSDECRLHSSQKFVTYIDLLTACLTLVAAGLFAVVCMFVRNLQLYGDQGTNTRNSVATEMMDFRSQLSQALNKPRKSLTGEDEKLLSPDPKPAIVVQRAEIHGNEQRISMYEAQRQKAASYSEELNKLLQASNLTLASQARNNDDQNQTENQTQTPNQTENPNQTQNANENHSPNQNHGVTIRKEGMLTTLL